MAEPLPQAYEVDAEPPEDLKQLAPETWQWLYENFQRIRSFTEGDVFNQIILGDYPAGDYVLINGDGILGHDTTFGNTFQLPTDGSKPTFSSGIISETIYEIYNTSVLKTSDDPASDGGVILNNSGLALYDTGGNLTLFLNAANGNITLTDTAELQLGKTSYADTTAGIWAGKDGGVHKLYAGDSTNYLKWDGTALAISGALSATSGVIGGWTINADSLSAGSGASHIELSTTLGIWAGHDTFALAPFSVTLSGALKATSGYLGNFEISASGLEFGSGATKIGLNTGVGIWLGADAYGSAPFYVSNAGVLTAVSGTVGGWHMDANRLYSGGVSINAANHQIYMANGSHWLSIDTTYGYRAFSNDLGLYTARIPIDGTAPQFAAGIIYEFEIEIYETGVIRTGDNVASTGGITISKDGIFGYSDTPELIFSLDLVTNTLTMKGSIEITSGSSGIANLSDAGALATADSVDWDELTDGSGTQPDNNATVGATWGTNLGAIPARFGDAASAAGLYLTATHLGYYDGVSAWPVYISNTGLFQFQGDGSNYITWNGATLTIAGTLSIVSASGYANITDKPTNLSAINSTEGTKLTGIADGADVTGDNTAADTALVSGVSATTVKDNAAAGATFTSGDAGGLAYEDAVDLATSQVTNKTAANIAETATLKWAGESGADITGNNTAADTSSVGGTAAGTVRDNAAAGATFTSGDAGTLAYQNTADYGTDVSGTKPPANADNTQAALVAGTEIGAGYLQLSGTTANIAIGASRTFGSTGIQLQYNSGAPQMFVGSSTAYLQYTASGITFFGGTLKTAATGTRVEISPAGVFDWYDAGTKRMTIDVTTYDSTAFIIDFAALGTRGGIHMTGGAAGQRGIRLLDSAIEVVLSSTVTATAPYAGRFVATGVTSSTGYGILAWGKTWGIHAYAASDDATYGSAAALLQVADADTPHIQFSGGATSGAPTGSPLSEALATTTDGKLWFYDEGDTASWNRVLTEADDPVLVTDNVVTADYYVNSNSAWGTAASPTYFGAGFYTITSAIASVFVYVIQRYNGSSWDTIFTAGNYTQTISVSFTSTGSGAGYIRTYTNNSFAPNFTFARNLLVS